MKKKTGRKKSIAYRFLSSKAVLVGSLAILTLIGITLTKEVYRNYEINREIRVIKENVKNLELRNKELTSLLEYFETDSFREREARQKLNLQKEGEIAVAIPSSRSNTIDLKKIAQLSEQGNQPNQNPSNPIKWWNYFFKNRN